MPGLRIILLEMATEDAEQLARYVNATEQVVIRGKVSGEPFNLRAKVEAIVAKPTASCKCDVPVESKARRRRRIARRESSWHRGARFGWWVCSHCSKPSKAVVTHWITSMLVGAQDLLPEVLRSGPSRSPLERWRDEGGISQVPALYSPRLTADHPNRPASLAFTAGENPRRRRKAVHPRRENVE